MAESSAGVGGTDILEDMKRLQREIDELRIQSERATASSETT